ncbi:DUF429 domain-containing protein [Falsirhodobacter sp. 1013]|uniref:DUF429 domain-containing protein n=1 Tax=Falsirhodobacter sp. 1013 TaxID=3417566 RepID=UPI003EBC2C65
MTITWPIRFSGDMQDDRLTPTIVAHCDWSVDPRKRWMAVARRQENGWHLGLPEPVGATTDLFNRLRTRQMDSGSSIVGFDFPIGVPAAYGNLTGAEDFRTLLAALGTGEWGDWFNVCSAAGEIGVRRPFYPMRPGGTRRLHLTDALRLPPEALLRACERATPHRPAACSLFWTLGGNQVGKGAISGWREVLRPHLDQIALWPFDGTFDDLSRTRDIVVVETYPGDVYGQIGLPAKRTWSKRTQDGRRTAGKGLTQWIERHGLMASGDLLHAIEDGFSDRPVGEDQFDAVVGLFGMLDVIEGRCSAAPTLPLQSLEWEGWIFGQDTIGGDRRE